MVWAIIALALAIVGGAFFYGKKRGWINRINDTLDDAREDARKDADESLDEKRNDNAWDNLNDTLDRARRRKTN